MDYNVILQGDALAVLKTLPSESVDCVVTSPPYWALRDYGVEGQLGLEPTFQEYINKLCDIFDEVKRVLKKEGTCWINLGDVYGTGSGSGLRTSKVQNRGTVLNETWQKEGKKEVDGFNKCLLQIPSRFAIEMCNRGWILRNRLIWHKPNCMPSSVKDRFTVDYEDLFFFVKSKKYYFETQYDKAISGMDMGILRSKKQAILNTPSILKRQEEGIDSTSAGNGFRNKRCVWTITTKPFKEAHFATYPEDLVETPIKAGCPQFICKKCGKAREKIYEHNALVEEGNVEVIKISDKPYAVQERKGMVAVRKLPTLIEIKEYLNKAKGSFTIDEIEKQLNSQAPHHWFSGESYPTKEDWLRLKDILKFDNTFDDVMIKEYFKPAEKMSLNYSFKLSDCGCNAGFEGGVVLDPFFGAGTTGLVARKLLRNWIGIELNPKYIEIAKKRIAEIPERLDIFQTHTNVITEVKE